ncbi:MAG: NAD(P)/FAD-dependent oxidoreductase [Alphaproteobacteria bacterium]
MDSYYARTATAHEIRPALDGVIEAEVCIVGGGLAGLSAALGLAERDASVVLVEAKRVGWGASGRNGGFVSAGFSLPLERLISRLGRAQAQRLYALSADAVALMRRRIEQYGIDCDPIVEGILAASWFDDRDGMLRERDFLAEATGVTHEFWPRERLREALVSPRYYDGLLNPAGFQFHPLNYCLGIARAAEENGARVFESSAVIGLDLDGAVKTVRTATGAVRVKAVIMACGGYIDGLYRPLSSAIVPVATYVVVTEPLGERLETAIRTPYAVHDTRFALDYYRPLADTRILWGGRISLRRNPPDLAGLMLRDLLKVYPQLRGVRVETAWSGLMSYAAHKMPQIGEVRPGVWYAMGLGGHGMNTATMAGEALAAAIAEGDDRYRLFAPFGLTPTMGPLGAAAAQISYWCYEARDIIRAAVSRS